MNRIALLIALLIATHSRADNLGSWAIDELLTFPANTHATSGAATDADSVPSYRVYEDETGTAILSGSMAKLDDSNTTGFYSEQLTLSAANGFEKGKSYSIYISAAVGGVTGTTSHNFQVGAYGRIIDGTGAGEIDTLVGYVAVRELTDAAIDSVLGDPFTADSGSTTTIVDAALTYADTDYLVGSQVLITSGSTNNQIRRITAFNSGTDTITVSPAFTQAISTNTYVLLRTGGSTVSGTVDANIVSVLSTAVPTPAVAGYLPVGVEYVDGEVAVQIDEPIEADVVLLNGSVFSAEDRVNDGSTMADTTVTVSSQTVMTLNSGTYYNDELKGGEAHFRDISNSDAESVRIITTNTGAVITLESANGFTVVTGDEVTVLSPKHSNIAAISRDMTAADNLEMYTDGTAKIGVNVEQALGAAVTTTLAGKLDVNADAISGDATAATNAEASFDGTGYNVGAGQIVASSVGAVTGSITPSVTVSSLNAAALVQLVSTNTGEVTAAAGSVAKLAQGATDPEVLLDYALGTHPDGSLGDRLLTLPNVTAGAANGLLIAGSNSGTTFATLTSTGAFSINGTNTVAQTGDSFARIGSNGAGLTAVPWNASWDSEVQSEADDALIAKGLDHLLAASVTGTDVTDNSIIAYLASKSATADWDSFVNTTDSLQAIRDDGVGGGGGGTDILTIEGTDATDVLDARILAQLQGIHLDHLFAVAAPGGGVPVNSSLWSTLVSKSGTPDYTTYVNTTDSLEAIRDRGDSAWTADGAGSPISPYLVDRDHTWRFDNRNQITATNTITEGISGAILVAMDFDEPMPALSSISSIGTVAFADVTGETEPTITTSAVSADKKSVVVTINTSAATDSTYVLSVTITTTDSQTFIRKGRLVIQ